MDLITPSLGLLVWQLIVFIILLIILKIFAWKPIINFIEDRENRIKNSINISKKIEKKYSDIELYKDNIIKEAHLKSDIIIKNAINKELIIRKENKKKLIADAKIIFEKTKKNLQYEENKSIKKLEKFILNMSFNIAESILKNELSSKENQKNFLKKMLESIKL